LPRELKIDKAVYLVDDKTKTDWYFRRNKEWTNLESEENKTNKKAVNGYTRVFCDGRAKTYKRSNIHEKRGHPPCENKMKGNRRLSGKSSC
jgi:hypothetical protein